MQNYLKDTKQIFITPGIRNIIREFDRKDIDLALEILEWIHNNFENINDNTEKKMKLFRKRTADEIVKSKELTGCTDYAIVFIALARAKKIPTKYIEAIKKTWLDTGDSNRIEGHVFAECLIEDKWYIIDPQRGVVIDDYKGYVIYKKGLDSWSIGIKSFDELESKFFDFRRKYRLR